MPNSGSSVTRAVPKRLDAETDDSSFTAVNSSARVRSISQVKKQPVTDALASSSRGDAYDTIKAPPAKRASGRHDHPSAGIALMRRRVVIQSSAVPARCDQTRCRSQNNQPNALSPTLTTPSPTRVTTRPAPSTTPTVLAPSRCKCRQSLASEIVGSAMSAAMLTATDRDKCLDIKKLFKRHFSRSFNSTANHSTTSGQLPGIGYLLLLIHGEVLRKNRAFPTERAKLEA